MFGWVGRRGRYIIAATVLFTSVLIAYLCVDIVRRQDIRRRQSALRDSGIYASFFADGSVRSIEYVPFGSDLPELGERREPDLAIVASSAKLDALSLRGTKFTDEYMARLRELPSLTHLDLSDTAITSASLHYLSRFSSLRRLQLNRTGITTFPDAFIPTLASLKSLELANCRLQGDALARLSSGKSLEYLDLRGVCLSSDAISAIAQLRGLTHLMIELNPPQSNNSCPPLPAAAWARLEVLKTLEFIDISNSSCSDASLRRLCNLPKLSYLTLIGNPITDDGLLCLHQLDAPREIFLQNTKVTLGGVQDLRIRFPHCNVGY